MDKGRVVLRGRPGQGPCQDWLINGGPQGAPCLFSALVLLQLLTKPALKRLPWKHNITWHRSAHWALPREGHIVLLAWLGPVSWEGKLSEACGRLSSTFGRTCVSYQHCLTQVGQHISFLSHHLCPLSSLNPALPKPVASRLKVLRANPSGCFTFGVCTWLDIGVSISPGWG